MEEGSSSRQKTSIFSKNNKTIFWRNNGRTESQEAKTRDRIWRKIEIKTDNGGGDIIVELRVKIATTLNTMNHV